MRLIDADVLLKKLLALFNYRIVEREYIKRIVDDMPTIEQKHAHWIYNHGCQCSVCHRMSKNLSTYCQWCGAKMDEVTE